MLWFAKKQVRGQRIQGQISFSILQDIKEDIQFFELSYTKFAIATEASFSTQNVQLPFCPIKINSLCSLAWRLHLGLYCTLEYRIQAWRSVFEKYANNDLIQSRSISTQNWFGEGRISFSPTMRTYIQNMESLAGYWVLSNPLAKHSDYSLSYITTSCFEPPKFLCSWLMLTHCRNGPFNNNLSYCKLYLNLLYLTLSRLLKCFKLWDWKAATFSTTSHRACDSKW